MKSKPKTRILIGLALGFILILGISLYPKHIDRIVDLSGEAIFQKTSKPMANADFNNHPALPAASPEQSDSAPAPDVSFKGGPFIDYPEKIMELLGVDTENVKAGRGAFKNSVIHVEWMDRVNDVLKNLSPEKKAAMITNHLSHLYLKDLLNEAYLSGKIDHDTFVKAVADLMKWHQKTYEAMLTEAEYETLFEVKPETADGLIDEIMAATPRYSFITNQSLPAEELEKQIPGIKLEQVDSHFKKMILDREQIGKKISSGEMTLEQARAAMNKSQQAFIAKCKELLTEEEINIIFGSITEFESGITQTEPPAVIGDDDLVRLGFRIENPTTSVDMVMEKIDKTKREDIKFFYQQWIKEKDALIAKLDAGEIKEDVFENAEKEMDKTFEENCRSVLTDAEYQLIFDREPGSLPQAQGEPKESEPEQSQVKDR